MKIPIVDDGLAWTANVIAAWHLARADLAKILLENYDLPDCVRASLFRFGEHSHKEGSRWLAAAEKRLTEENPPKPQRDLTMTQFCDDDKTARREIDTPGA